MGYQRQQENKQRNLVAKHAAKFNSSRTFTDRKRAAKMGRRKHKGKDDGYTN